MILVAFEGCRSIGGNKGAMSLLANSMSSLTHGVWPFFRHVAWRCKNIAISLCAFVCVLWYRSLWLSVKKGKWPASRSAPFRPQAGFAIWSGAVSQSCAVNSVPLLVKLLLLGWPASVLFRSLQLYKPDFPLAAFHAPANGATCNFLPRSVYCPHCIF